MEIVGANHWLSKRFCHNLCHLFIVKGLAFSINDAVVRAGATRLRPVLLTAVTTVLGLLPMVTGVSVDFHNLSIATVSESTQWWQSMAIVVIFGLMLATFLTLIVVPTFYSFLDSLRIYLSDFIKWIKRIYWRPLERLTS